MKKGQKVGLYRPDVATRTRATIVEIQGAGASHAKILKLAFSESDKNYEIEGVKHQRDAIDGEPFWLEKGERAPKGWSDIDASEDAEVVEPVEVVDEEAQKRIPAQSRRRKRH